MDSTGRRPTLALIEAACLSRTTGSPQQQPVKSAPMCFFTCSAHEPGRDSATWPRGSHEQLPEIRRIGRRWRGLLARKRCESDMPDGGSVEDGQQAPDVVTRQHAAEFRYLADSEARALPPRRRPAAIGRQSLLQDGCDQASIVRVSATRLQPRLDHPHDSHARPEKHSSTASRGCRRSRCRLIIAGSAPWSSRALVVSAVGERIRVSHATTHTTNRTLMTKPRPLSPGGWWLAVKTVQLTSARPTSRIVSAVRPVRLVNTEREGNGVRRTRKRGGRADADGEPPSTPSGRALRTPPSRAARPSTRSR